MTLRTPSSPKRRAFTLLELVCAIATIAILAALLLPALHQAAGAAKRIGCSSNLHQVGIAFHNWTHEHNNLLPMQVSTNEQGTLEFAQQTALNPDVSSTFRHFQALSNALVSAKVLACPADRQRVPVTSFDALRNENVSYWINPEAVSGRTYSPLAGDRNVRTSGRTEWTFLRFGTNDRLEFSAELHGHRGNVLFADSHVEVLESAALQTAFASGSSNDTVATTLSLPRPDPGPMGTPEATSGTANGGAGQSGIAAVENRPDTTAKTAGKSQAPSRLSASKERSARNSAARDVAETPEIITRLDGTTITSSVTPRALHGVATRAELRPGETTDQNPIVAFAEWLTHAATTYTYWLLLLLLLALIAFEIARRRARRKRLIRR